MTPMTPQERQARATWLRQRYDAAVIRLDKERAWIQELRDALEELGECP